MRDSKRQRCVAGDARTAHNLVSRCARQGRAHTYSADRNFSLSISSSISYKITARVTHMNFATRRPISVVRIHSVGPMLRATRYAMAGRSKLETAPCSFWLAKRRKRDRWRSSQKGLFSVDGNKLLSRKMFIEQSWRQKELETKREPEHSLKIRGQRRIRR